MQATLSGTTVSMKTIRFCLLSVLFAGFVLAVSAYSTNAQTGRNAQAASKLNCGTIQKQLRRDGLIYLYTKRGRVERFVRDTRLCTVNRSVRYTTVRSKDKRYCTVTRCSSEDLLDDHSRGHRGGHHGHHGRGRY